MWINGRPLRADRNRLGSESLMGPKYHKGSRSSGFRGFEISTSGKNERRDVARYTVRVELHPDGDYDALHEAMEKLGFVRWSAWNGVKRELPPAEYSLTASLSAGCPRPGEGGRAGDARIEVLGSRHADRSGQWALPLESQKVERLGIAPQSGSRRNALSHKASRRRSEANSE